jgi:hypothetical protein
MYSPSEHLPPEDAGTLDGHIIGARSTSHIQQVLDRARRKRSFLLTYFLPSRRRYLDALIRRLEQELQTRRA